MAGYWMKIEKVTPDKPEIEAMAAILDIDPDEVFGKLFRIWSWFDDHTVNGNAPSVTAALLNRRIRHEGFVEAMQSVGWLVVNKDGISLPNFDRHCGETAKQRGLTAKRVTRKRNASVTHPALPDKIREDKNKKKAAPSLATPKPRPPNPIWDAVVTEWFPSGVGGQASRIGKIVKDLKSLGATPDDIRTRHLNYQRNEPTWTDTPEAIVKHWDRCGVIKSATARPGRIEAAPGKYDNIGTEYDATPPTPH